MSRDDNTDEPRARSDDNADVIRLDAATLGAKIAANEVSSTEVTRACLDQIAATDGTYRAFLHVAEDQALAEAARVDAAVAAGEKLPSPLAGVPLALKDVFTTIDMPTTCGSRILEGWTSPYDATVTARVRSAGIPILGKTNMDEFAMGSSTENSAYGPTRNPWNTDRVPGGSGGGSAAALAAFQAPLAIGTDTGGSIRQPAALTATVGVKPTYGTVSRYGLIACASSLDQGGPCARTVLDTALLHQVIAGHDPKDSTSVDAAIPDVVGAARVGASGDLKGVRIGVVRQLRGDGYQAGVLESFNAAVEQLTALGAEVSEVDCPHFDYSLPAYYLILPSEVSSNLARFDGMRYGLREGDDGTHSAEEVMALTRAAGFGPEVKRRIMIGAYALSAGYYDAYYNQAQKVRTLIARDLDEAYQKVDVLVSPATPTTAFPLGEKVDDPLAMYLFDLCTLPLNLAGHCGMSVPSGLSPDDNLPVGLQIMAPALADDRLYRVGAAYEAARGPLPTAV
jgi:aspartyl-tRNA(Asn)/glutamyl-tRNA(Gln) amidotransferase subunit A